MFCPHCGQDAGNAAYCPHCGNTVAATPAAPTLEETKPEMPMKWFKFLIYFGLWVGALSNLGNGLGLLTGSVYDGMAAYVYTIYSSLHSVDLIFGFAFLAVAAFTIVVRFKLAGFKKDGPTLLYTIYVINVVVGLAYALTVSSIIGEPAVDSSFIGSLIGSVTAVIVNMVYFKKRAHLFVN